MKDTLTFTLIQTRLAWEQKEANLSMLEQKIRTIPEKTEIVVLPEMFATGFTMNAPPMAETMEGPTVAWMRRVAAAQRIVLTGTAIIREADAPGEVCFYNRLIWMLPNGQYGVYNKRHLFAYAGENEHYRAGEKRLIASVKDWKINLQVCYDLRFPVWARQTPQRPGTHDQGLYDVLVYVANWPERRSHAWKTLLQARAIENQCYVIGVNRVGTDGNGIDHSGDSMVVDPLGATLYHRHREEDIFTITLDKKHLNAVRARFPFGADADPFQLL